MSQVRLPALDGRTPLGFLAAIGVLRLLHAHCGQDVGLAFSRSDAVAVLHGMSDVDEVVTHLREIVANVPADGALPGAPVDFPPPGAAPDRMRMQRHELRALTDSFDRDDDERRAWVQALVTDLALDDKQRVALNPFCAPTGKQSARTMLEKPLDHVRRNPDVIREALVGWRRYPGVTGEGLDYLAYQGRADTADGRDGQNRGVPGATWLALMAVPNFPVTAIAREATTSGWQRRSGRRARRELVYPLWDRPLSPRTIAVLLGHPLWRSVAAATALPPEADVLGVFLLCVAQRELPPGGKSAGYLKPERVIR